MHDKVQSVLFPKMYFTLPGAMNWLERHNFQHSKVDITDRFYRFRQRTPLPFSEFYTQTLPNKVELVILK